MEIEAENDKTHYPLPLSMVELDNIGSLKKFDITPATLRQLIRQMGETISEYSHSEHGTSMSSGFGLNHQGASIMNRTIGSNMNGGSMRKTAREFFSKDNLDHPSIDENRHLKQELERMK